MMETDVSFLWPLEVIHCPEQLFLRRERKKRNDPLNILLLLLLCCVFLLPPFPLTLKSDPNSKKTTRRTKENEWQFLTWILLSLLFPSKLFESLFSFKVRKKRRTLWFSRTPQRDKRVTDTLRSSESNKLPRLTPRNWVWTTKTSF